MKERILSALKAKFQGVNANILDRIATMLAKTVTTDEQVTTAVEGVTKEFIDVVEAYGDSRATEAATTAVQNYESKYKLHEGKPTENPVTKPTGQKPKEGEEDTTPAWAQSLIDSNKALTERLNQLESDRTTASRRQQIASIVAKLPEKMRKPYERIGLDNLKDEEFESLKNEITTEVDGLAADIKSKGAVFGRPTSSKGGGKGNETLTKEQEAAIAVREGAVNTEGQPF